MLKPIIFGSAFVAAMIVSGCSGVETATELSKGYLVDSAVANVDYDCVADGEYNQTTDADGAFACRNTSRIRFRVGKLVLGEITAIPEDGYVLPQDLVGSSDLNDPKVIAVAQLLQSLDEDGDVANGIQIPEEIKTRIEESETFDPDQLETYLDTFQIPFLRHRTQVEAWEHLHQTVLEIRGTTPGGNVMIDINSYPYATLTQELKDAIAYMGNEERLAHDVYLNLYAYHANSGIAVFQLQNISDSEARHVETVQSIVRKYNLTETNLTVVTDPVASSSVTVDEMPAGEYGIPAIQSLYDALYAKGTVSQKDALEVGCMVEVTDINDLDEKIVLAQESNATDVEAAFTALRNASYNHYWAFDKGLKNIGVAEGCCALGTIDGVNYCHSEYPQNSHGWSN